MSSTRLNCTSAFLPAIVTVLWCCPMIRAADNDLGDFTAQADVGTVEPAGSAKFDKSASRYRIQSAGDNIWAKHDDFHFLYRNASGDTTITADVELLGEGKNAHRKAGCMIRQ